MVLAASLPWAPAPSTRSALVPISCTGLVCGEARSSALDH